MAPLCKKELFSKTAHSRHLFGSTFFLSVGKFSRITWGVKKGKHLRKTLYQTSRSLILALHDMLTTPMRHRTSHRKYRENPSNLPSHHGNATHICHWIILQHSELNGSMRIGADILPIMWHISRDSKEVWNTLTCPSLLTVYYVPP